MRWPACVRGPEATTRFHATAHDPASSGASAPPFLYLIAVGATQWCRDSSLTLAECFGENRRIVAPGSTGVPRAAFHYNQMGSVDRGSAVDPPFRWLSLPRNGLTQTRYSMRCGGLPLLG